MGTVARLNSLLRGELAAVLAYQRAFERVRHFPEKHDLVECEQSHRERAELLRGRILQLGGEPVESAGAWGTFATLVESAAAAVADKLAIRVLQEGEERGLRGYTRPMADLDPASRALVRSRLLPEQLRTERLVREAKTALG